MKSTVNAPVPPKSMVSTRVLQGLVAWAVIALCAAQGAPSINESHYLPKAKHVWNADFAPGDLFLESHDSHFLASLVSGIAAKWMPLSAVAWIGRIVSWTILAVAWVNLSTRLGISSWISPLALGSWYLGMFFGHWAGEWAIGGFEAKSIAFGFVLLGIGALVVQDWKWVWVWMGTAMAWHPIVGGWAGLSCGLLWLICARSSTSLKQQIPWLAGGASLGLVGVLPAVFGITGPDVVDKISAAQVHVYYRLAHHLSPQLFAGERHLAAVVSVAALCMASLGVVAYRRLAIFSNPKDISASSIPKPQAPLEGVGWLLACAWLAVGLALVGLAIDLGLSSQRPDIAAKLLRFYWFRWADVMVPLASSLAIWKCIDIAQSRRATIGWHWLPTLLAASATLFPLGLLLLERGSQLIPPADRLIVESTGSVDIATPDRYLDWLAVCAWIEQNTPTDSLWLTPKYQQSFKWHAGRAEIVCWKDVPQDNAAVIEWYQRVQRCEPPRNAEGTIREWTTEEILDLADDYHFQWILIDKTFQQNPLGLEIAYPVTERGFYPVNRSFAVFHIPESMMPRGPESRGSGAF